MFVTPRTILANHTLLEPNAEVIAGARMFSGAGWGQRGSVPCGTSLEGLLALGKEMLQAMGKFQCWPSQALCTYSWF